MVILLLGYLRRHRRPASVHFSLDVLDQFNSAAPDGLRSLWILHLSDGLGSVDQLAVDESRPLAHCESYLLMKDQFNKTSLPHR